MNRITLADPASFDSQARTEHGSAGNCAPECIGERQGRASSMGDTSMLERVRRLKVDHR
jgi:hypothetical protein